MKKIINILFIIILLAPGKIYCQQIPPNNNIVRHVPLTLADKVNKSDAVVEGIVINQTRGEGFRGSKGNIFTPAVIRITKVFKGDIKDTIIELISDGGMTSSGSQTSSMWGLVFKGYQGIFFLRENNSSIQSGLYTKSYLFVYENSYIYYSTIPRSTFHSAYFEGKNIEDFENILYKPIEAITGTPRKVIGLMPFEEAAKKQQK
jgi:hypothetical protein